MKVFRFAEGRNESQSIMEDASGKYIESLECDSIQETGQEQRPARMVGLYSLDSAQPSMDAGPGFRRLLQRQGEGS